MLGSLMLLIPGGPRMRGTIYSMSSAQFRHLLRGECVSRSGYIYVLVNPSLPGLVKIGRTEREPEARARELSGATGVPTPFLLVFEAHFDDAHAAEDYVHAFL